MKFRFFALLFIILICILLQNKGVLIEGLANGTFTGEDFSGHDFSATGASENLFVIIDNAANKTKTITLNTNITSVADALPVINNVLGSDATATASDSANNIIITSSTTGTNSSVSIDFNRSGENARELFGNGGVSVPGDDSGSGGDDSVTEPEQSTGFLPGVGACAAPDFEPDPCDGVVDTANTPIETAQDACNAVQEQKGVLASAVDGVTDVLTGPTDFLNNLVDNAFGNIETTEKMESLIQIAQNAITDQQTESTCQQNVNSVSSNVLAIDQTSCLEAIDALSGLSPDIKGNLAQNAMNVSVHNVTQEIEETNMNKCKLAAAQTALQSEESSVENSALQSALNDLQGSGRITSNSETCTNINQNSNACSFMKTHQCCLSSINSARNNTINLKCGNIDMDNVVQSQIANNDSSCDMTNEGNSQQAQTASASNVTSQAQENEESPDFPWIYLIILIILLLAGVGGSILYYKKYLQKGSGSVDVSGSPAPAPVDPVAAAP